MKKYLVRISCCQFIKSFRIKPFGSNKNKKYLSNNCLRIYIFLKVNLMNKHWLWAVLFGIKLDVGALCDNRLHSVIRDICNPYNRRYLSSNLCITVYYSIPLLGVASGKRFCGWVLRILTLLTHPEYVQSARNQKILRACL